MSLHDLISQYKDVSIRVLHTCTAESSVSAHNGYVTEDAYSLQHNISFFLQQGRKSISFKTDVLDDDCLSKMLAQASSQLVSAPEDPDIPDFMCDAVAIVDDNRLQMYASSNVSKQSLCEMVLAMEDVVQSHSLASESSNAAFVQGERRLYASGGIEKVERWTTSSISCIALASGDGKIERDYDYLLSHNVLSIQNAQDVATYACIEAKKRLGGRAIGTGKMRVIFSPRVAAHLLHNLLSFVDGMLIIRDASMMKDKLGEQVFSSKLSVLNDPLLLGGLESSLFDAEGTPTSQTYIVQDGVLCNFLTNQRVAHKLGVANNANASSFQSVCSRNASILPGDAGNLISQVQDGVYVTEILGDGFSPLTGDTSHGIAGYKVENGECVYPISGVTLAYNVVDFFRNCVIGSDFDKKYRVPSLLCDDITVAGA